MRKFWSGSFRRRLFGAFLAAAMVPLLLCAGSLLQIFRLRLSDAARTEAQAHLNSALYAVETAYDGFVRAAERLAGKNTDHPLRGAWLDRWLDKTDRALTGLARAQKPEAAARLEELKQLQTELSEMKKEWEAWQR